MAPYCSGQYFAASQVRHYSGALIPIPRAGRRYLQFWPIFGQNRREIGRVATSGIPTAWEKRSLSVARPPSRQDYRLPVQCRLSFFLAWRSIPPEPLLSVLDEAGCSLLSTSLLFLSQIRKEVTLCSRISVHHRTLQQRFIIRLIRHGNKSLPHNRWGSGLCLCRHDD